MRRFTLVLAAVAALSLMATSTAQAATLSHGAATALAVGAVGHHPGPYYEPHRAGWHRGPGMHRPPVVVVPYPPRPVIVVPQPVYPAAVLLCGAPRRLHVSGSRLGTVDRFLTTATCRGGRPFGTARLRERAPRRSRCGQF